MARDPGSLWRPLPEAGAPDGNVKTQFIVHSTGTLASAKANADYFARPDVVVESTFIIGLSPADPTLQVMDSTDTADSNMSANQRAIAVEVVGDGIGPFTDWQISELIRLGRWAAATHPIQRRVIPSEPASGFGWHVMFGAPGPWTSVRGKVCPGNARVEQLKTIIFPAIFAGTPQPAKDWFDMATKDELAETVLGVVLHVLRSEGVSGAGDAAVMLDRGYRAALQAAAPAPGGVDLNALADLVVTKLADRLNR